MTPELPAQPGESPPAPLTPTYSGPEIAQSLRGPVLLLVTSAAIWLLIASVFALIASIKFHSPNFLADTSWLTYGRVRPAWFDCLAYGFGLQAGLAIALWLLARLGQRPIIGAQVVFLGGVLWNFGLTAGVIGVLSGDSTGFENIEIPGYAAVFLFIGWVLIGIPALLTFHYRARRSVYAALWFILAVFFWFPWIYSTACLLLITYPVRGVTQTIIAWWYSQNLVDVCFGMLGLGASYYLVPRLTGRPLHSRYLALTSFWALLLFSSWGGIPGNAPVPAWMPAVSQVANLLSILLLLTVGLNIYQTRWATASAQGAPPVPPSAEVGRGFATPLAFVLSGITCFLIAGAMTISASWLDPNKLLAFTWFSTARLQLQVYGFLALVLFGAAYYLLPETVGVAFCWPKLVRAHLWLAVSGIVLIALPLAVGGLVQRIQLGNPDVPFMNTVKLSAHFLRVTTMGELLLLLGHVLFFANITGLLRQLYRLRVVPVYETATEDLFKTAEGKA